eukprot:12658237-Alexandrium_andersonii.AAC.1
MLAVFGSLEGSLPLLRALAVGLRFDSPCGEGLSSDRDKISAHGRNGLASNELTGEGERRGANAYFCQGFEESPAPVIAGGDRVVPAVDGSPDGGGGEGEALSLIHI